VDRRVAQCLLRILRNLRIGKMSVHFLQSRRIAIDDPAPSTATRIIAMRAATALACRAGRRVRPESRVV
jgi:hypothetical protein